MGRAGDLGDVAATSGALSDISKTSTGLTKDLDGLKVDVPKTDPLPGGRPGGPPTPKPFEAPVEPTPRPVESAPPGTPAPHSPTAPGPGRPEPPVVPHEPAPGAARMSPRLCPQSPAGTCPRPTLGADTCLDAAPHRRAAARTDTKRRKIAAAWAPGGSGNWHEPLPSGQSDPPGPSEAEALEPGTSGSVTHLTTGPRASKSQPGTEHSTIAAERPGEF